MPKKAAKKAGKKGKEGRWIMTAHGPVLLKGGKVASGHAGSDEAKGKLKSATVKPKRPKKTDEPHPSGLARVPDHVAGKPKRGHDHLWASPSDLQVGDINLHRGKTITDIKHDVWNKWSWMPGVGARKVTRVTYDDGSQSEHTKGSDSVEAISRKRPGKGTKTSDKSENPQKEAVAPKTAGAVKAAKAPPDTSNRKTHQTTARDAVAIVAKQPSLKEKAVKKWGRSWRSKVKELHAKMKAHPERQHDGILDNLIADLGY